MQGKGRGGDKRPALTVAAEHTSSLRRGGSTRSKSTPPGCRMDTSLTARWGRGKYAA